MNPTNDPHSTFVKTGAWIFVSHSHRDLEKVRRIRNELERRGHNPLVFFLKCLEANRLVEQILEKSEGVFLYVKRFCIRPLDGGGTELSPLTSIPTFINLQPSPNYSQI
jgi:hypothetical protein